MSAASKITLAGSVVFTLVSVTAVHYMQNKERERMHDGVLRDEARIEAKQRIRDNERELEAQRQLERELRKQQVMASAAAPSPPTSASSA
ncbi:hypothetical protein BC828DRAFT_404477 [Blastocladiella britannica]|nr:hypothetical protein BC828DRAFT_404477 [Blastocladiella britannica]